MYKHKYDYIKESRRKQGYMTFIRETVSNEMQCTVNTNTQIQTQNEIQNTKVIQIQIELNTKYESLKQDFALSVHA